MRTFVPIISRSCSPSVKKFGEFEILPCLRTKKMTCQNSMGAGAEDMRFLDQREKVYYLQSLQCLEYQDLCWFSEPHITQNSTKRSMSHLHILCVFRGEESSLENLNILQLAMRLLDLCPGWRRHTYYIVQPQMCIFLQREPLSLSSKLSLPTSLKRQHRTKGVSISACKIHGNMKGTQTIISPKYSPSFPHCLGFQKMFP